jgi:hypothetical protein
MVKKITFIIFLTVLCLSNLSVAAEKREKRALTPTDKATLITALKSGYIQVFNKPPNNNTLAMSLAQVNLENAHGKKVYNHNLGNVGPRFGQKVPFFILGGSKFIAHKSFHGGAVAYWTHLKVVCSGALPYFSKGYPAVAGYVLRSCNYYTAPKQHYTRILAALFPKALKRIEKQNKK